MGSYCSICRGNQDVSKMEEIAREFGINRYSTVSTIIDRTRNEVVKKRRIRRRIEQLRHELEMSQKQTDPIIS